jgi:hypothetical protein
VLIEENEGKYNVVRRGSDKSLTCSICSTTKIIFLGWVKAVGTPNLKMCGARGGGNMESKYIFSKP